MSRLGRVVVTCYPHNVRQGSNPHQLTSFFDSDYADYISLVSEWCKKHNVAVWSYCLMPKHVHDMAGIDGEIFMQKTLTEEQIEKIRRCEQTVRPAGCEEFIVVFERNLHR